MIKINTRHKIEGYTFLLPGIVYILIILGYPLIYNIVLSFRNVNIGTFHAHTDMFVGLENYRNTIKDSVFRLVFTNTLQFTIACLIVQFTVGFLFALFFSQNFTLSGPIRGLVLIGYMMPMSVTALVGKNIFGVSEGVVNDLLLKMGLISSPIEWLISTKTALSAVIAVNCWVGIPFNMLLLTSGLTGIPQDIYDSAMVDGANAVQRFLHITLPLLKTSILAVLMLGFIYTFKAFDLMFIMTAGGPLHSTDVLGTYAYTLSFQEFNFSMGATTAIILFGCLLVVGIFYLYLITNEDK